MYYIIEKYYIHFNVFDEEFYYMLIPKTVPSDLFWSRNS